MSQENVGIVREQFEATNRRDFARPMADWADDIEVVETREGDIRSGTYVGREAVGEFFGAWFRAFRAVHFELLEIRDGGDSVAVAARHRAQGKHSGIVMDQRVTTTASRVLDSRLSGTLTSSPAPHVAAEDRQANVAHPHRRDHRPVHGGGAGGEPARANQAARLVVSRPLRPDAVVRAERGLSRGSARRAEPRG
jgi:ketosteroid isomerase-like protein